MKIKSITAIQKIIDRETDVAQIINLFQKGERTQVHIVYAETGYGKSAFTDKLSNDVFFSNWNIVKVKTMPQNADSNVPEGDYLECIFTALMKHFNVQGHTNLFFETYLVSNQNELVKNLFVNQTIEQITSTDSIKSIMFKLGGMGLKRLLKVGEYDLHSILNNISPIARCIKADYIRYLFDKSHILLIIDNIQNIDKVSLKFLLDWINETKNKHQGFIFEYTISESYPLASMELLQHNLTNTGADIYVSKLDKLSDDYIADLLEIQINEHSQDIHFTINAIKHYNDYSKGNLWELIDYARLYDEHKDQAEMASPTLLNLKKLSQEAKYIVSILFYHNGGMDKSILDFIWLNRFSNSKEELNKLYVELNSNRIICFKSNGNNEQITISHSSILDVYKDNLSIFLAIDKETFKRLSSFYIENYNGDFSIVSKEFAWQILIRLYVANEPKKIAVLIDDFKSNVMRYISKETTWCYIKAMIECTKDDIPKFESVYFQILRICRAASLYKEGFSCLNLMENQIDIKSNSQLFLFKLLYLSILDDHVTVIKEYEEALNRTEKFSQIWIKLKLLVLNSYIALSDKKSCINIDKELRQTPGFRHSEEYPFYLRLTNIYAKTSRAAKNAKKSIELFRNNNDIIQEGKSYITYSKLLSSLGNQKKAIDAIKHAQALLEDSNVGISCIYNNLAGYMLLSGDSSSVVWDYLNIAEIHSVSTYDKLSVIINKLAWCYENNAFVRLDLLKNQALELISKEPSKLMHCTTYFNFSVVYRKADMLEQAEIYYQKAVDLKDECLCIKARIDGITFKTRYLTPRIKKPYHICYLSFWLFDI